RRPDRAQQAAPGTVPDGIRTVEGAHRASARAVAVGGDRGFEVGPDVGPRRGPPAGRGHHYLSGPRAEGRRRARLQRPVRALAAAARRVGQRLMVERPVRTLAEQIAEAVDRPGPDLAAPA